MLEDFVRNIIKIALVINDKYNKFHSKWIAIFLQ